MRFFLLHMISEASKDNPARGPRGVEACVLLALQRLFAKRAPKRTLGIKGLRDSTSHVINRHGILVKKCVS